MGSALPEMTYFIRRLDMDRHALPRRIGNYRIDQILRLPIRFFPASHPAFRQLSEDISLLE